MTQQQRWAEGPNIGTPPRHHPTSIDHMIDVLARLRDELYESKRWYSHTTSGRVLREANAILKTYGR